MAKRSPSQSRKSQAAAAAEGAAGEAPRWCLSLGLRLCFFFEREKESREEVEVEVEFFFSSSSASVGLLFLVPYIFSSLPTLRRGCSSSCGGGRPVRRVQTLNKGAGRGRGAESVGVGQRERHWSFFSSIGSFAFLDLVFLSRSCKPLALLFFLRGAERATTLGSLVRSVGEDKKGERRGMERGRERTTKCKDSKEEENEKNELWPFLFSRPRPFLLHFSLFLSLATSVPPCGNPLPLSSAFYM